MDTLKQLVKSLSWGISALLCTCLVLGGGYLAFLHSISVRDIAETTRKAREISAEINSLSGSISGSYARMFVVKDIESLQSEFLDLRNQIANDERELFRILNSEFCGDGLRYGCVFTKYDPYYADLLHDSESSFRSESTAAWWASDVELYIQRQTEEESVAYQNSERRKATAGSLAVLLIGAYLLVALARFKRLAVSDYFALATIVVLPLIWAAFFATSYVDPRLGYPRNLLGFENLYTTVFFGSFVYPFLAIPPIYVYATRTGRSLFSLVLLRDGSKAK